MSDHDHLVGRTITDITLMPSEYGPSDSDGPVLVLDNGIRIHLRGGGYEDSYVTLVPYSETEWSHLVETASRKRREAEERKRQAAIRRESDGRKWEVVREHMRSICTPRAFEIWEQRHPDPRVSWNVISAEVADIYAELVRDANRQAFGLS